jgi:hypothetical protein
MKEHQLDRRRLLKTSGAGIATLTSGCLERLQSSQNMNTAPPPETTATNSPTATTESDSETQGRLGGIGYSLQTKTESSESVVDLTHSLRVVNTSNTNYFAVFVNYGPEYSNKYSQWLYNLSPGEERIVDRFDPDNEDLTFSGEHVYPSLWPESIPDTIEGEIPGSAELSGKTGTHQVLQAEVASDGIRIPIPDEMSDANVSDANIRNFIYSRRFIKNLSSFSTSGDYIQIPIERVAPNYFGGNPYMIQITGVSNQFLGILTFPMPSFTVDNFTLSASTSDGELVWDNLSYELSVGESAFDQFPVTHTVLGPDYPLGRSQTEVQSNTTNSISVEPQWMDNLDIPVESKEVSLIIHTPYPVSNTKSEFKVN